MMAAIAHHHYIHVVHFILISIFINIRHQNHEGSSEAGESLILIFLMNIIICGSILLDLLNLLDDHYHQERP